MQDVQQLQALMEDLNNVETFNDAKPLVLMNQKMRDEQKVFDADAIGKAAMEVQGDSQDLKVIQKLHHSSDVYEFREQLGRGAFGKVYEAFYRPTEELIAVKVRVSNNIIVATQ